MKTKLLILLLALLGISSPAMAFELPTWTVTPGSYNGQNLNVTVKFKDGQNTTLGAGYIFAFVGTECRLGVTADGDNYSQNSGFYMSIFQKQDDSEKNVVYTLYYFNQQLDKMYIAEIHYRDCFNQTGTPATITIDISNLPSITVPINITAAKWATITLPFDVTLTASSVTAYTCESHEEGKLTLTEVQKSGDDLTLTACTPYLLYSETVFSQDVSGVPQALSNYYFTEGLLTGNVTPVELQGGDYGLQNLNDKVAFYPLADGATATLPANRVYISRQSATGSEARGFFFDEETAIDHLTAVRQNDGKYLENDRLVIRKSGKKYSTTGTYINE